MPIHGRHRDLVRDRADVAELHRKVVGEQDEKIRRLTAENVALQGESERAHTCHEKRKETLCELGDGINRLKADNAALQREYDDLKTQCDKDVSVVRGQASQALTLARSERDVHMVVS